MGIGSLAIKAVTWLKRAVGFIRHNRELTKTIAMSVFANNERIAKRVEKFFTKAARVETMWGAHTNAWGLIEDGAKRGDAVTLPVAEVKYLNQFKRAFDKTIKPIGTKVAAKFDDDATPVPMPVPPDEVPDITPVEDDDTDIDDGAPGSDISG